MSTSTSTPTTEFPAGVVMFDRPTTYVDRDLPTASWWDEYEIQPGIYPLVYTTIDGSPQTHPIGDVTKVRPYYVWVLLDAIKRASHRENRLFTAVTHDTRHDLQEPTVLMRSCYAYRISDRPESLFDGRLVLEGAR